MPSQVTNYQCPACTGPLHFAGDSGKLECDYCGSAYEVSEIEALYQAQQLVQKTARAVAVLPGHALQLTHPRRSETAGRKSAVPGRFVRCRWRKITCQPLKMATNACW